MTEEVRMLQTRLDYNNTSEKNTFPVRSAFGRICGGRKNTYYLKMGKVGGENLNSRWTLLSWKIIITGLWKQKMKLHASCFEQACRLYGGEFLPVLSGEVWAESLRSHYQDIYFKGVREACRLMKNHRDHQKIVRLCDAATAAYPPGRVGGAKDWSFVGVKAVWRRVKDI